MHFMKCALLAILLATSLLGYRQASAAGYALNDNFAAAIEIKAPISHYHALYYGSYEDGEPLPQGARHKGATSWYSYVATKTGFAVIDLVHQLNGQVILSAFTGESFDDLDLVASRIITDQLPDGSYNPTFLFRTEKGKKYFLQFDGLGSYSFVVSQFGVKGGIAVYPSGQAFMDISSPLVGSCYVDYCLPFTRNWRGVNAGKLSESIALKGEGMFVGGDYFDGRDEKRFVAGGGEFLVDTTGKNPTGNKVYASLREISVTAGSGKKKKLIDTLPITMYRSSSFAFTKIEATLSDPHLELGIGDEGRTVVAIKNAGTATAVGCFVSIQQAYYATGLAQVWPSNKVGDLLARPPKPVNIAPGKTKYFMVSYWNDAEMYDGSFSVVAQCANVGSVSKGVSILFTAN
jgi:hypothetical protein